MNPGLDAFVFICWISLGLLPLGIALALSGSLVLRSWARAREQIWQDHMEKLRAKS